MKYTQLVCLPYSNMVAALFALIRSPGHTQAHRLLILLLVTFLSMIFVSPVQCSAVQCSDSLPLNSKTVNPNYRLHPTN